MLKHIQLTSAAVLAFSILTSPVQAANSLVVDGAILKNDLGTTFDAWTFKILGAGSFTVDVAAYEASQSSVTAAGYYTHDINGDGELTWLDPDTYFYHDTGAIQATGAIFRCDDVQNNCGGATGASNYFNGYTPETSPLTRTSRLQSEAPVDSSAHFRRDPWYDVTVNTAGDYLFLIADFRLDPAEAAAGINGGDSFSAPTGFAGPVLDHADYRVTFSSSDMLFSLDGNTIVVSPIPEAQTWAMLLAGLSFIGWRLRNQSHGASGLTLV
jgi:hypothetical protein